jgi:hypothetical protein
LTKQLKQKLNRLLLFILQSGFGFGSRLIATRERKANPTIAFSEQFSKHLTDLIGQDIGRLTVKECLVESSDHRLIIAI